MPSLGPAMWSVAEVCAWLSGDLELPESVVASFKANAVAGCAPPPRLRRADAVGVADGSGWSRRQQQRRWQQWKQAAADPRPPRCTPQRCPSTTRRRRRRDLLGLSDEDLTAELGLTKLQVQRLALLALLLPS